MEAKCTLSLKDLEEPHIQNDNNSWGDFQAHDKFHLGSPLYSEAKIYLNF